MAQQAQEFFLFRQCHEQMKQDRNASFPSLDSNERRIVRATSKALDIGLSLSARFSFSDDLPTFPSKRYSQFADLVRLPFPAISILTKEKGIFERSTHTVVLACDTGFARKHDLIGDEDANRSYWECPPNIFVFAADLVNGAGRSRWMPIPLFGGIHTLWRDSPESELTYSCDVFSVPGKNEELASEADSVFNTLARKVLNLCVMLNLCNVQTEDVSPDPRFNRHQISSNRLPLETYKILKIDGQAWGRSAVIGFGSGKRSHMRRGHIRRLDESRHVWVRATSVKGSRPGAVHKIYKTTA